MQKDYDTAHPAWLDDPWLLPTPRVTRTPWEWSTQSTGSVLRDDLLHPWAGGNKLRKLDGLWPRKVLPHITDVVTCGGVQSAHCVAVGALAAQHGKRAHLLVRGELPQRPTGHAALSALFGTLYPQARDTYAHRQQMFEQFLRDQPLDPSRTVVIPEGADCDEAMLGMIRLVGALAETLPARTRLVIDSGTGTSAAGLCLGVELFELPWRVESVCLLKGKEDSLHEHVLHRLDSFRRAHCMLAPSALPLTWHPRRRPRRFGTFYEEDVRACVRVTRQTGIVLDPIYTLGAWNHCEDTEFDGHTCLIHTGGGLNVLGAWDRKPLWYANAVSE